LAFLICQGGWPGSINLTPKAALQQALNYVDALDGKLCNTYAAQTKKAVIAGITAFNFDFKYPEPGVK
jgi:hypothetical protein